MSNKITTTIFILLVAALIAVYFIGKKEPVTQAPEVATAETSYICNENKSIIASYFDDFARASVVLSDGRTMSLNRTISADGVRYSDGDPSVAGNETFVFWSKGRTALVLENNEQKSYIGCVEVASDTGDLSKIYHSPNSSYSIRYPQGFSLSDTYSYNALGPGKSISGVSFTIDPMLSNGTNLSSDTYVSVETIPGADMCTADLFLEAGEGEKAQIVTRDGNEYSVLHYVGAGAGNRYDETVFAFPGTNPCMAVRYFIHYGAIGNYDEGAVKEFNMEALLKTFDAIRNSLRM